jgi:uncharacterized protein
MLQLTRWTIALSASLIFPSLAPASPSPSQASKPTTVARSGAPRTVSWDDLLPADERDNYTTQPVAPVHGYLGEAGPAAPQAMQFDVNKELDGAEIRLPGFVVPLDLTDGKVSEFFIVPYFGACIHVPPPPPNQLVYVKLAHAIPIEQTYNALMITGQLHATTRTTRLASAAYTLQLEKIEPYKR